MLNGFGRAQTLLVPGMVAALMLASVTPVSAAAPGPRRAIVGSVAAGTERDEPATAGKLPPMTNAEEQAFGCLGIGGAAMALSGMAGYDELILVFAGGAVSPTTTVGHAVAVAGMIFASFCAVGALATPAFVWMWDAYRSHGATPVVPAND